MIYLGVGMGGKVGGSQEEVSSWENNAARERGSHDNITVVVVFLRDPQDLLEPEPDAPRS